MGNPAVYAVRGPRARSADVRHAHFGAPTLVADVFAGADHLLRLHEGAPRAPWPIAPAVDAGFAMCLRSSTIAMFARGLDGCDLEVVRRLLAARWPGWTVRVEPELADVSRVVGVDLVERWAKRYSAPRAAARYAAHRRELGAAYGQGPEAVATLGDRYRARTANWRAFLHPALDDFRFRGVWTIRDRGSTVDRLSDADMMLLLHEGPTIVRRLPALPTVTAAHDVLWPQRRIAVTHLWFHVREEPVHALVDRRRRQLDLTVEGGPESWWEYALAHSVIPFWPGWTVTVHRGGALAHFERQGRALPTDLDWPEDVGASRPSAGDPTPTPRGTETLSRLEQMLERADQLRSDAARVSSAGIQVVEHVREASLASPSARVAVRSDPRARDAPAHLDAGLRTPPVDVRALAVASGLDGLLETAEQRRARDAESALLAALADTTTRALRGDGVGALATVDEVVAVRPEHIPAHRLGIALHMTFGGGRERLRARLEALARLEPDDALTLAVRGNLLGSTDDALQLHEIAWRREPTAPLLAFLHCVALLGVAEKRPGGAPRRALLERVIEVLDGCPHPFSHLLWCRAAACSLGEDEVGAADAIARARRAWIGDLDAFDAQLLADRQLEWLWSRRGRRLPPLDP